MVTHLKQALDKEMVHAVLAVRKPAYTMGFPADLRSIYHIKCKLFIDSM